MDWPEAYLVVLAELRHLDGLLSFDRLGPTFSGLRVSRRGGLSQNPRAQLLKDLGVPGVPTTALKDLLSVQAAHIASMNCTAIEHLDRDMCSGSL
jgi:hypothetical protein